MEEPKTRKPRKKETQPRNKETQPRKKRSPETKRRNPAYEGLTPEQIRAEVKKNHYIKSGKLYQAIRRRCIKHDMKKEDFEGIDEISKLNDVVAIVLKKRGLDDKIISQVLTHYRPKPYQSHKQKQ